MGILTEEMKQAISAIRLGFVATVSPDGRPNLSARGSLCVWDDDHLAFADIASPHTTKNLETNPYVEINTVDQIGRRGFRFKGTAIIERAGEVFDFVVSDIHAREGPNVPVRAVIKVRVTEARALLSPAYTLNKGITEAEVRSVWMARYGYRRVDTV
jgi:predicted pyridoxine 5'-phosphate oxidase superfamily flavin-nucleotide-binding protein